MDKIADKIIAFKCDGCGGSIFVGDEYWQVYSDSFCEICINACSNFADEEDIEH